MIQDCIEDKDAWDRCKNVERAEKESLADLAKIMPG
jgi:hypothetical protein